MPPALQRLCTHKHKLPSSAAHAWSATHHSLMRSAKMRTHLQAHAPEQHCARLQRGLVQRRHLQLPFLCASVRVLREFACTVRQAVALRQLKLLALLLIGST